MGAMAEGTVVFWIGASVGAPVAPALQPESTASNNSQIKKFDHEIHEIHEKRENLLPLFLCFVRFLRTLAVYFVVNLEGFT
jgi:hypothetical protein